MASPEPAPADNGGLAACVSFMLIRDSCCLVERRRLDKPVDPGLVAIPGGHIEPGETHTAALARELQEELSIQASGHRYLCSLIHPASEPKLLHYYVITTWQGTIDAREAECVFWLPLDEPHRVDVAADRTAIGEYLRLRDVLDSGNDATT